jgi:hypothetical protein
MTLNSRSAKLSSPNVKVQDVPDRPTIGTAVVNLDTVQVPFTPATTGGRAAVYRAVSNPGGVEAISFGSSPISVPNLDDGVARTFTVRGETSTGATTGFSAASNSVTVPQSALEPIATAGAAGGGWLFSNIPQTYQDLMLVINARSTNASSTTQTITYFNGDAGASNYSRTVLNGNGSAPGAFRESNFAQMYGMDGLPAANATANIFSSTVAHILNYKSTSTFKSMITRHAADLNGSGLTSIQVGLWRSTAAISQINISLVSGSVAAGSTATLYGIRVGS